MGPLQKKWVKRLKAHPERQGRGILGDKKPDGSYKACCLGEAGLMLGSCSFRLADALMEQGKEKGWSGSLTGLPNSHGKLGLRSSDGYITSSSGELHSSLAAYNDDPDYTWTDIAYMIEAVPELFFTEPK